MTEYLVTDRQLHAQLKIYLHVWFVLQKVHFLFINFVLTTVLLTSEHGLYSIDEATRLHMLVSGKAEQCFASGPLAQGYDLLQNCSCLRTIRSNIHASDLRGSPWTPTSPV